MQQIEIRVRGVLDASWSEWFDDLTIEAESNNQTLLSGSVRDQAALFGLLLKIRDLGLSLVSVTTLSQNPTPLLLPTSLGEQPLKDVF